MWCLEEREDPARDPEGSLVTLDNMKTDRDAAEEFFEYDAEEFLVFLTLLITEGRTPEYSVKGRTEGLHCPPAQSAMPPLHKHECSDKLPQCRQARRTRSEVILLWRNSIPIMIEVMLLPDCCYGDECPPSDLISDPVIKQDALLLERWTLQPVPRQSGDRFIEEKTLLLAVRSYVFFSQLSAWLSASHGIVPRNILYRISAADEELVWQFSQPPSEHIFPVPNVSQSVALQVRVQSLPRQPTYPTLACSIHTGLPPLYGKTPTLHPNFNHSHGGLPAFRKTPDPGKDGLLHNSNMYSKSSNCMSSLLLNGLPVPNLPINNIPINSLPHTAVPPPFSKKSQEPADNHVYQNGDVPQVSTPPPQGSPLFHRPAHSSTPPRAHSPSPLPTGKAGKWLYSSLNGSPDSPQPEDSSERSKVSVPEPLRAFKNISLAEPPRCPSPRPAATETNPLIGSLLQERQEVIARIAQRLNFCDPTAPPLPPGLFAGDNPPKAMWGSNHEEITASKTKEPEVPPYESMGALRASPFNTPLTDTSISKRESLSPKPAACRKLKMTETKYREEERSGQRDRDRDRDRDRVKEKDWDTDRDRDSSIIAQAVQDITRLIQERLSVPSLSPRHSRSSSPVHHTHTTTVTHTVRTYSHVTHIPQTSNIATNGYTNGHTPGHEPHRSGSRTAAAPAPVCTDETQSDPGTDRHSPRVQNGAPFTLEEPLPNGQLHIQTGQCLRTPPSHETHSALPTFQKCPRNVQFYSWTSHGASPATNCNTNHNHTKPQPQPHPTTTMTTTTTQNCVQAQAAAPQDENQAPTVCRWTRTSSPDVTPHPTVLRTHSPSPLRPCNSWKKQNRHSLDATATKAFHPCTGLPLLSSPVPQRRSQTGYFDLDTSLTGCKGLPWASGKRVCPKGCTDESQQLFSTSAPPASLSLLGNFEECVLNYRLEPLGTVEGFTAEVGASGSFCPSHLTLPVDVFFYSVSDDNAPSPYMGVINLESLGKRGYRVPPSGTIQVTLFNPNKTVVKMFVVMYDLRSMPAGHQTFLRQRTFSVPVRRESNNQTSRKPLAMGHGRTLRYLVHLRFQSSKSGKIYLHRDIRLLFSRKSMEVDSGAAYELQSFTESPVDPPFSSRC
ncbi:atos homolog protein A isoform X2 [Cynoglossus semilaevis]|uniref:Atos homolog protein A n=2 Tax=Cynoglossus semilaevis TaxID=244447 RepID=A0A3P8VYG9_CYNSE|nr:protein FAM214A isoform X2 [Cynoglossus semilaevis]